jgi:hypothetical protein
MKLRLIHFLVLLIVPTYHQFNYSTILIIYFEKINNLRIEYSKLPNFQSSIPILLN